MKGIITAGQSVQFTGNYLPCNISLIDVWFLVVCRLYDNLHHRELGPAMRSNGPLAQVKTVDFSPFIDGSAKQHVSNAMLSSLTSIGFVYLTNYGFPDETIQNMFNWVHLTGNPILLRLIMPELVVEAIFLTTFGSQAMSLFLFHSCPYSVSALKGAQSTIARFTRLIQ
jgi:hypothetical protein